MTLPVDLPAWQALTKHFQSTKQLTLRDHFAADSTRFEQFQLNAAGLFLDYSKNHVDSETMHSLVALAGEACVPDKIAAMFAGDTPRYETDLISR